MLFSVIIPVYNADKYIQRAIESILHQNLNDIEIVLINDGSSDNSDLICREMSEKYKNIIYISTENKGVSHARNIGIEAATSEWITFLDADDQFSKTLYNDVKLLLQEKNDLLIMNYIKTDENINFSNKLGNIKAESMVDLILDYTGNYLCSASDLTNHNMLFTPVWGKFYKREIINNNGIRFDERLKLSEDLLFNIIYCKQINSVRTLDKAEYYYTIDQSSVSHSYSIDYLKNQIIFLKTLLSMELLLEHEKSVKRCLLNKVMENIGDITLMKSGQNKQYCKNKLLEFIFESEIYTKLLSIKKGRLSEGKIQNIYFNLELCLIKKKRYDLIFNVSDLYYKIRS